MQLIVNKIANYWIRTEKFLHQKQPLYNCAKSTAGNIGIFYVGCKYLFFFLSFFLSFFFFRKIADSTKHIFCFLVNFPIARNFWQPNRKLIWPTSTSSSISGLEKIFQTSSRFFARPIWISIFALPSWIEAAVDEDCSRVTRG